MSVGFMIFKPKIGHVVGGGFSEDYLQKHSSEKV